MSRRPFAWVESWPAILVGLAIAAAIVWARLGGLIP